MSTPKRFRFTNQLIKSLPLTHPMHAVPMPNTATPRFPASSVWSAEEKVVKSFCYATFIMDENAPSPLVTGLKWTSILLVRLP